MKTYLQALLLLILFGSLRAPGATPGVELLGDRQMAAIRGGICFYEKCEDPPGDGTCQPFPDDVTTLCKEVQCTLDLSSADGVDLVKCIPSGGANTCSESETYLQCIRAMFPHICVPNPLSNVCGYKITVGCFPDIPDRRCYCDKYKAADSCDWQSCLF